MNHVAIPTSSSRATHLHFATQSTSISDTIYRKSAQDFIRDFYSALHQWRSETAFESDPDRITSHPEYKKIVGMGDAVQDLIIHELRVEPSLLVWALDDIVGVSPYSKDAVGNIVEMTEAWLAWAERDAHAI